MYAVTLRVVALVLFCGMWDSVLRRKANIGLQPGVEATPGIRVEKFRLQLFARKGMSGAACPFHIVLTGCVILPAGLRGDFFQFRRFQFWPYGGVMRRMGTGEVPATAVPGMAELPHPVTFSTVTLMFPY